MSLGDEQGTEFVLYKYLPEMKRYLKIDALSPYLRAVQLLTDDEFSGLEPHPPNYVGGKITHCLAKMIYQKGDVGLEKFKDALKRSVDEEKDPGHKELLRILDTPAGQELATNKDDPNIPVNCTELHVMDSGDEIGDEDSIVLSMDVQECPDETSVEHKSSQATRVDADLHSRTPQQCEETATTVLGWLLILIAVYLLVIGLTQLIIGGKVYNTPVTNGSLIEDPVCQTIAASFHLAMGSTVWLSLIGALLIFAVVKLLLDSDVRPFLRKKKTVVKVTGFLLLIILVAFTVIVVVVTMMAILVVSGWAIVYLPLFIYNCQPTSNIVLAQVVNVFAIVVSLIVLLVIGCCRLVKCIIKE